MDSMTAPSLLATLIIERDFATFAQLPAILYDWLRLTGFVAIFALLGLVAIRSSVGRGKVWTHGLSGMLSTTEPGGEAKLRVLLVLMAATFAGLIFFGGMMVAQMFQGKDPWEEMDKSPWLATGWLITSILALATLSWEFVLSSFGMSGRRLWAIARFSIIEALRKKVLWGFGILLLLFLFGSWFISSSRAETQWSTYVNIVYFILMALTLVTASTVACFSIPNDIRLQSIHTIVTKPVQKFEIVLGRILGLVLLLTVVLLVAALLSLLYIVRGVDPKVRETALRARQPLFGFLEFQELNAMGDWVRQDMGTFIGREYDLRQYIRGGSNQEAVWKYPTLEPRFGAAVPRLAQRDQVFVEFAFDIFRTSKGGPDRYREGVDVQLTFINRAKWRENRINEFRDAKDPQTGLPLSDAEKARIFGYYEPRPIRIVDEKADYYRIAIPGTLFDGLQPGSIFEIRVGCRTYAQYLGCYRYDLYLLDNEGNFFLNYLKGASSIWFFMVLVVVLGVVFSTYLNAPVSLMLVWLFMLLGQPALRGFMQTLTVDPSVDNPGGNALESLVRMVRKEALTSPLDESAGVNLVRTVDRYFFKNLFKAVYFVIPDIGQYNRAMFVAEGFNIPADELGMSLVLLLLYLFPFLLAGFYLINLREIAG